MKKKLTKRELRENKLLTYTLLVTDYIRKHLVLFKKATIFLLAVVLIIVGFSLYSQKMNERAEVQFIKAMEYYREPKVEDKEQKEKTEVEKEKYEEVLGGLQLILDRYPRSSSASEALFYLGNSYYQLGDYEKAIEAFGNYVDKYPRKEFAPMVLVSLGNSYEQKGQYKEALQAYEKLINKYRNSFLIARAHLDMGSCYEELGEREKAEEAYQKILDFYPQSIWVEDARWRIERVKNEEKD